MMAINHNFRNFVGATLAVALVRRMVYVPISHKGDCKGRPYVDKINPINLKILRKVLICIILIFNSLNAITQTKPNIIIIVADDLGYNDVGYNGSTYYLTPTIDSLAKQSLVFNRFYSMPTCSPTRASLMTGCYTPRHGIYAVDAFSSTPPKMRKLLGGESKKQLDKETYTMPVFFKNAGYKTALIGKWHLGDNPLTFQNQPIFDTIIGRAVKQEGHPHDYFLPSENIHFPEDKNAPTYLTDRLTYETERYIETHKNQPFFLYLAHYAPHVPLMAKKEDADLFENRTPKGLQNRPSYAAMVYAVDRSLKKIVEKLKENGLADNTIIWFLSDNGGQLISTDNAPFRGQKGEFTEGGIHVPSFIWGKIAKSGKTEQVASVVDIFPTLTNFTQQQIPMDNTIDGINLSQILRGGKTIDRSLYFHFPAYTGNGKSNANVWQSPASAILKGDWKMIQSLENQTVELYNLKRDVAEKENVAAKNPKLVKALTADLKQWQTTTNALMPTKENSAFDPNSRNWIIEKDRRQEKDEVIKIKIQ